MDGHNPALFPFLEVALSQRLKELDEEEEEVEDEIFSLFFARSVLDLRPKIQVTTSATPSV